MDKAPGKYGLTMFNVLVQKAPCGAVFIVMSVFTTADTVKMWQLHAIGDRIALIGIHFWADPIYICIVSLLNTIRRTVYVYLYIIKMT